MPDEEILSPELDEDDDPMKVWAGSNSKSDSHKSSDGDSNELNPATRLHKIDMTEINQLASLVGAQHLPGDVD